MTQELTTQAQKQHPMVGALDAHGYGLSNIADQAASKGERIKLAILQQARVNPRLRECNPAEIVAAAYKIAALDLDASGATGEVWIIPKGDKVDVWLGAQGMITLAYRSGLVSLVTMGDVREGDDFAYNAADSRQPIQHTPRSGTAPLVAHWAQAVLSTGHVIAAVVFADEFPELVQAAKDRLRTGYDRSPWPKHASRMIALVALRRCLKRAPKSVLQLPGRVAIDDDGVIQQAPVQQGRLADEVVAETLALTADQCNQGDEVES
jgi:phage RecT family recombinase